MKLRADQQQWLNRLHQKISDAKMILNENRELTSMTIAFVEAILDEAYEKVENAKS